MDTLRKAYFSGSWYPGSDSEVRKQLEKWNSRLPVFDKEIHSGIVPHAGWYFSGEMAFDVIRRFPKDLDLLVVLGGHLPERSPFFYIDEDLWETPCGNLPVDHSLLESMESSINLKADRNPDNTIEVQLPIIRALLGDISIVPVRVPAGSECLTLISSILKATSKHNLKTAVLGSTDLTHYGLNYDYTPYESKEDPVKWVEESDRKILQSMIDVDSEKILSRAKSDHSACSAGAAACASFYAAEKGIKKGELLRYDTSYTKYPSESFVGYGAVIYEI